MKTKNVLKTKKNAKQELASIKAGIKLLTKLVNGEVSEYGAYRLRRARMHVMHAAGVKASPTYHRMNHDLDEALRTPYVAPCVIRRHARFSNASVA